MIQCACFPDRQSGNDFLSDPAPALTDEDHELCDSLDQPTPEEISVLRLAWEDLAA